MPALHRKTPKNKFLRRCLVVCLNVLIAPLIALLIICTVLVPVAHGQQQGLAPGQIAPSQEEHAPASPAAPLADLLSEAERNNPQIQSMRLGWEAAKQIPSQVSPRPDPQF